VACVEKDATLGGTCLNVGCIPSKALLESSERYLEARGGLTDHGVLVEGEVGLDLPAMMGRKDRIVEALTRGVAGLFKKNKVTRYTGVGRLLGSGLVAVDGAEPLELACRHVLIATGSAPASLPGVELDFDRIGTSTTALAYPEVPGRLIVIGAGVIGLELGSVWRRLGSEVTVVEFLDRILPEADGEIARHAQRSFKKQGLAFVLGARVTGARRAGDGCVVEIDGREPLGADRVLVAVGRVPHVAGLGLAEAGVALTEKGRIRVDERFQTSLPGVHAIGDVIGGAMLAHKASDEGVACVENLAGQRGHVNYDVIPNIVYTEPEVASVGRTEEQLAAAGVPIRKGLFFFKGNGRALALGNTDGAVKVIAHAETDRVLGVHIIGPRAGDLIAEAAAAMEWGASAEDLARLCHAHPTLSEALKEAALAVAGRPIHA
jgi:dihydrolipoamide dehydrogenase